MHTHACTHARMHAHTHTPYLDELTISTIVPCSFFLRPKEMVCFKSFPSLKDTGTNLSNGFDTTASRGRCAA